jgi:hypothetical protein
MNGYCVTQNGFDVVFKKNKFHKLTPGNLAKHSNIKYQQPMLVNLVVHEIP